MSTSLVMQYIFIGIIMLCGYVYLLQLVAQRTTNKTALPLISVLLLLFYGVIAAPVVILISQMRSLQYALVTLLMLFSCVVFFVSVRGFIRDFRYVNKGMLLLFLTYVLAVGYITVFSRDGSNDTSLLMLQTDLIRKAIRTRSLEPVNHLLLNIAMFVPLGFLLPFVYPQKLARFSYVLLMGMMFTTMIESTQMVLRLGQADLTDIVTNILGALIGFFFYRVARRFYREE